MTLDGALAHLATLTTERLELRQMQMADAEALFAIKSNPEVTSCYGQEAHQSIGETRAWIQRSFDNFERRDAIVWALTLKGKDDAIGACCLWNFDPTFHCAELGYELHPAYWHKGMMTEALSAILNYGFVDLGLHRVEATPLVNNGRSRELLCKLGFRHEGLLRQRVFFEDRYEDQLYLGLLKQEWLDRTIGH
jgi:ribosomal-protein-alanine N-acetyltransferase